MKNVFLTIIHTSNTIITNKRRRRIYTNITKNQISIFNLLGKYMFMLRFTYIINICLKIIQMNNIKDRTQNDLRPFNFKGYDLYYAAQNSTSGKQVTFNKTVKEYNIIVDDIFNILT